MQMPKNWAIWLVLLTLLTGCASCASSAPLLPTPTPQPVPPAPAFVTAAAAVALPQLVAAERDAAIRSDRPLLAQLWAPDARIVDSRGTAETADDFIWQGRAAILDRYDLAVFPSPPPAFATPPAFTPQVAADTATATLGHDRWRFQWDGQRWWLLELHY
jgi:hypothetical protein